MHQSKEFLKRHTLGRVGILTKPEQRTDKMEKAQITTCQFVKARKDAPKMLELMDQTFNHMSLPVPPGIVFARQFRPLR